MVIACVAIAGIGHAKCPPGSLDRMKEDWTHIEKEPERGGLFNYDVVLDYGHELMRDIGGTGRIEDTYWRTTGFYLGNSKGRRYLGTNYNYGDECSLIILQRKMESWKTRRTLLHELGHHISVPYLLRYSPHDAVWEKHADFWAGAIAYRINKDEQGWTAKDLHNGRDVVEKVASGVTFNRVNYFNNGWDNAEYGDSIWWFYGAYLPDKNPDLWEPSGSFLYSVEDDDGWIVRHIVDQ